MQPNDGHLPTMKSHCLVIYMFYTFIRIAKGFLDETSEETIWPSTLCRWKGDLDCGKYDIQCLGRGFVDCTGSTNDQGFQAIVSFLRNANFLKSFVKNLESSGDGQLSIEHLLKLLLHCDTRGGDDSFSLFEDMESINNDTAEDSDEDRVTSEFSVLDLFSFHNDPHEFQPDFNASDAWDLFDRFTDTRERPPLKVKEDIRELIRELFDSSETNDFHKDKSVNQGSVERRKEGPILVDDNLVDSIPRYRKINASLIDETEGFLNLAIENATDPVPSAVIRSNTSLMENYSTISSSFSLQNNFVSPNTKKAAKLINKDNPVQRPKRSMVFRPSEISMQAKLSREPLREIVPQRKKYRKPSVSRGVVELQRRHEFILHTLREFKKHHSYKDSHLTTEEALTILAADLLHKLHWTSSRSTREINKEYPSYITGGPGTGTCRVFNLTCYQLPPLATCKGTGIGGCIHRGQFWFYNMPRFFVVLSVLIVAVLSIASIIISLGIYRRMCRGRVVPDEEITEAETTDMVQSNGSVTNNHNNDNN